MKPKTTREKILLLDRDILHHNREHQKVSNMIKNLNGLKSSLETRISEKTKRLNKLKKL